MINIGTYDGSRDHISFISTSMPTIYIIIEDRVSMATGMANARTYHCQDALQVLNELNQSLNPTPRIRLTANAEMKGPNCERRYSDVKSPSGTPDIRSDQHPQDIRYVKMKKAANGCSWILLIAWIPFIINGQYEFIF